MIRAGKRQSEEALSKIAPWLAGILCLAALVAVVTHAGELRTFVTILQHARPWLLTIAVVLQISTYMSVALCWRAVLADTGQAPPLKKLIRLSIAKLFADQAIPSAGLSGNMLLIERLVASGVRRPVAVAAMAMAIVGYYCAYVVMALAVLLLLWLHKNATILLASAVSIFLVVALSIITLVFLLLTRSSDLPRAVKQWKPLRRLSDLLAEVPRGVLGQWPLLLQVTGFSGAVFLADATTLWVILAAIGMPTAFTSAFIAFILASMAVTLGPIPMGLGSFEGVSIGMLRALGVPIEAAATAVLVFRGFTLWLPLLPGMALTRRMFERGKTPDIGCSDPEIHL